jgi:glycosyltransferase involved in cell wall biosynthesis
MARDLAAVLGTRADTLGDRVSLKTSRLITVLPNPVDVERIRTEAGHSDSLWNGRGPHLLAVGRLSREKGFDLLLRALVTVRLRFPCAELAIVGAGREEATLRSLAVELGVSPAVRFAGQADPSAAFFSGATAYVLSSRHEGMPNALLEAAAGGLPIVALPASQGIVELLEGQPGIWLAASISADDLSRTLIAALENINDGQRFAHAFVDQFRLEHSIRAFQQLIDSELSVRDARRRL